MRSTQHPKTIFITSIAALALTACGGGGDKAETKAVEKPKTEATQYVKNTETAKKVEAVKQAEAPKKTKARPMVKVEDIFVQSKSKERNPTVSMESILNMQITNSGAWTMQEFDVVFAPENPEELSLTLENGKGQEIKSFKAWDSYRMNKTVYGRANLNGSTYTQLDPGDYALDFKFGKDTITKVPFSVMNNGGGEDAFGGGDTMRFVGPWQELGYLHFRKVRDFDIKADANAIIVGVWVGVGDTAVGEDEARIQAKLYRGKKLVAHSKETTGYVSSNKPFEQDDLMLHDPHERRDEGNAGVFSIADLVDGNHTYKLEVERQEDGEVIRKFEFKTKGGKLVPLPRTQLGYKSRSEYLAPRVDDPHSQLYEFMPVHWMKAK